MKPEESKYFKTIIIGAGPAGLAAGYELSRNGYNFAIFEKNDAVGGLARTYLVKEENLVFRTDYGPHRFFSKNQRLYKFVEEIIGDDWQRIERHTQQFIGGRFFDYPINYIQAARIVGPAKIFNMSIDYLLAFIKYKIFRKPIHNFKDYALANFGRALAHFSIINYTEKIWGMDSSKLHADWAQQRIAGLNVFSLLLSLIKKMLFRRKASIKTIIDEFYYPIYGTGTIYETIKSRIIEHGHPIYFQSFPIGVKHRDSRIISVEMNMGGEIQTFELKNLIESIHLTDFVKLLDPLPPQEVLDAALYLKYRSQVCLFITLDKNYVSKNQWIYFPESGIPFDRVSEMKNFSPKMSPPDKTSLFIEFFCNEGDKRHNSSGHELLSLVLPFFEKYGLFNAKEVRNCYVFRGGKDYPVYDVDYKKNLGIVKKYLDNFNNLQYIGRPGRFKYTNQDHSLEMGIIAAKNIKNTKGTGDRANLSDLNSIGSSGEYFEKGRLRN
ncbi:MAG: hypothetical protein CEN90_332 [Parcubacteria group bacterium Licking1014_17]|nr:MAG: hypothetical protein CEN90_332 [Parcubacteria group bacterium Licking1014_17]